MTRVNKLAKRLDKELFRASKTCIWKKSKIIPTQLKKENTPTIKTVPDDDVHLINTVTKNILLGKKRKISCCVRGCDVHSTKLKCVPRIPKLSEGKQSLKVLKTYYKKLWIRREYCDRFGIKRFN